MCGIAGVLSPLDPIKHVRNMLDALQHRGPDGQGLWAQTLANGNKLVLGHRRLSIIDLSRFVYFVNSPFSIL